MKTKLRILLGCCAFLCIFNAALFAEEGKGWSCQKVGDNIVRISADGSFFADYRTDYRGNPIVWPICSANGNLMSRGFPMIQDQAVDQEVCPEIKNIYRNAQMALITEEQDHPHHRSLWFNHGDVDGLDFWSLNRDGKLIGTKIVHKGFDAVVTQDQSVFLKTKNKWVRISDDKTLCTDERTLRFFTVDVDGQKVRALDYDITVYANEADVNFKDTKEGSFGFRVPGTMDITNAKRVKKFNLKPGLWGGKIVNSNGQTDDNAWGQRANWVDYSGPVPTRLDDKALDTYFAQDNKLDIPLTKAGITIMNHPGSFRAPSWYHVRTYGLFAVNPFGIKEFEKKGDGLALIKKGESLTFRYRVLFHDGELTADQLNKLFNDYSAKK